LIALAVQRELAAADAVGEAADGHAEVIGMFGIILGVVIAEQHVGDLAVAVGAGEGLQRRAIGEHPRRDAVRRRQRHRLDRGAVGERACRVAPRGRGVRLRGDHRHEPDACDDECLSKLHCPLLGCIPGIDPACRGYIV
jgi:hypothetical protein